MSNLEYILADRPDNNAKNTETSRFLQQETSTLVTVFNFLTTKF